MNAHISAFPHMFGRDVNPYVIHQRIWEAFPGYDRDSKIPFQFTIQEEDGQVYVRSQEPPEWDGLRTKAERTIYPEDHILVLEVLLNPVKRSRTREFLITDDAGIQAFAERILSRCGVQVLMGENDQDTEVPQVFIQKVSGKPVVKLDDSMVPLCLCRCTAIVQVTDSAAFQKALVNGVGRKKAFGAGMILVRSARAAA